MLCAVSRALLIPSERRFLFNSSVQQTDHLAQELEQSRAELLQLAARVQRLIGKRGEREALLQQLHRTATLPPGLKLSMPSYHLCSLCATGYAELAIQQVRGAAPGAKCDHCGQSAIVWVQLKPQTEHVEARTEPAAEPVTAQ
jgi:hypothetical protein